MNDLRELVEAARAAVRMIDDLNAAYGSDEVNSVARRCDTALSAWADAQKAPPQTQAVEVTDFQLDQLFYAVHEHGQFGREFREHARSILAAQKAPQPRAAEPAIGWTGARLSWGRSDDPRYVAAGLTADHVDRMWARYVDQTAAPPAALANLIVGVTETVLKAKAEPAPAPADEPPPLDIIAQAKRILVLVDRCIENHTTGNRSDLRAALLDELGAAKLQAERSQP
jgi:hypothetical protein